MNMNFDFNNPTRILFGSGKLNELGNQPMPGKKALLLMSGGKSAKVSGAHSAAPSKTAAKTTNIRLEKVFLIIHFLFRDNLCVTISNSFLFSLAYFAWCFNGKINKPAASLHGSCSRNGGCCVYLYFFRNQSSLQCTLQARQSSRAPAPCCHGRER